MKVKNKNLKKTSTIVAFLMCLNANSVNASDLYNLKNLPSPYCNLEKVLPFNGHGWYGNAEWMKKLFAYNKIVNAVEVGSWLGSSARHMASMLPAYGKLYCIDTWEGSAENRNVNEGLHLLPTLYEQFLSNVIHAGLTAKIVPIKMRSEDAVGQLAQYGQHFDLIYIDAAHDTESVLKDMEAYFPFVANHHGILCGDDWDANSVKIAVVAFAQKYNLTVYGAANFWFVAEEGRFRYRSFISSDNALWKFPKH